jgi:hypothetical protein
MRRENQKHQKKKQTEKEKRGSKVIGRGVFRIILNKA